MQYENKDNNNIEVKNLTKRYGKKEVLKGVNFVATPGEIIGLVGKNGAGKSTFLEILMAARNYDSGIVRLFDKDLKTINSDELHNIKKDISVVLQPTQFYKWLKVKELLALFRSYYTGKPEVADVDDIIEDFQLQEHSNVFFDKLSGGWKQRVSLAIAFLSRPQLLLLDEPTTGLDPYMRSVLWRNMTSYIKKHGGTVILSTHYMDEVEMYCDKVAFINDGILDIFDTPESILKNYGHISLNSFYLKKIGAEGEKC